jgi:PAS domain S-box-containing protein
VQKNRHTAAKSQSRSKGLESEKVKTYRDSSDALSSTMDAMEKSLRIDNASPGALHRYPASQLEHEFGSVELLDALEDLAMVVDGQGTCLFLNRSLSEYMAISKESLIGRKYQEFFPTDIAGHIEQTLERIERTESRGRESIDELVSFGLNQFAVTVMPTLAKDGTQLYVMIGKDQTEIVRLRAQRDLAIQRFFRLTEQCPIPVFQSSPKGDCVYANPALEQFFGVSASKLINRNLIQFVHPDDVDATMENHRASIKAGKPQASRSRIILRNGDVRYVEGYVQAIRDSNNNVESYLSCFVDITEHIQTQNKLSSFSRELEVRVAQRTLELSQLNMHLNEMISQQQQFQILLEVKQQQLAHAARVSTLGELASGLTHELNQPMQAATNYLSVLDQLAVKFAFPSNVVDVVQSLRGELKRATEIIRRTRQFVRPMTNQMSSVEFASIINETLALLKHELLARKIRVSLDVSKEIEERPNSLRADAIQLQQVFVNLIKNAMDAIDQSQAERIIKLQACSDAKSVSVEITDYGYGVPQENLNQLFTPFFTTKENGLGLGLSISRSIIVVSETKNAQAGIKIS